MIAAGIALAFSAAACKKDKTSTTNNSGGTATGIITCKVNGKDWKSGTKNDSIDVSGDTYYGIEAYMDADTMNIFGVNLTDQSAVILNLVLTSGRTGTYSGTTDMDFGAIYTPGLDLGSLLGVLLNSTITYSVNISKFDNVTRKVSGTFTITVTPTGSGTTYNVTSGAFTDIVLD